MRIVDFVDGFFERFREKFLHLCEDKLVGNSENYDFIMFVKIQDSHLTQKRKDLLVILLLSEMQERSLPDPMEQRFLFRIILVDDINKHSSAL